MQSLRCGSPVSFLCVFNSKFAAQKISRTGLNITHPNISHLLFAEIHSALLAPFTFFVKLDLVRFKIGIVLLLLFVWLFGLWNEGLDQYEVFFRLAPAGAAPQSLFICFHSFRISPEES